MKKLLFFALLGLAYQYSDRIRNIDFAWPDKSIARPNYSTERSDDWRARSDDWRARSDDWRARSDNRRARPDNSTARSDYSTARNDVILYATEWCGYCQKTRVLFKENNIPYVEYDIEKSERSYKEYKRLGGIGVPLLKINGKVVRGYQPQLILASMNSN